MSGAGSEGMPLRLTKGISLADLVPFPILCTLDVCAVGTVAVRLQETLRRVGRRLNSLGAGTHDGGCDA